MKYWLGVTDSNWFDFLSYERPDEVNFWIPNGKPPFVNLEAGAPFLFKLKMPFNHIAGGGYFVTFSVLPLSMAWETFGNKNGAASQAVFEKMIRPLTPDPLAKDPNIGCLVLTQPFFWPKEEWIEASPYLASSIVRGRYCDTQVLKDARLWEISELRNKGELILDESSLKFSEPSSRYGESVLVKPRLGQGGFRLVVTNAYQRRCAITGETTFPVLEAAHILPFSKNGPHEIANGLLLRSDFHKLFDLGYLTVTPKLNVEVSTKIRENWFNGKAYERLHGQPLANIPIDGIYRPSAEFLRWHNENCFQG